MDRPTVLIIDDEPGFLESLYIILRNDYNVMTAKDGRTALSIIDSIPVSLILIDLQMPGMTGIQLLQKIREMDNDTPVLVITGNSSHDYAKQCCNLFIQGYIEKPVDIQALLGKVKRIVGIDEYKALRTFWGKEYEERTVSIGHTVRKALRYLHDNSMKDISRERVAENLGLSPDHLGRLFHKECGLHIKEYVGILKMHMAKEYLLNTEESIGNIAGLIGIPDVSYFGKLFKKHTGATPREFRERKGKNLA